MKHKNSILICELDSGRLTLYVNGSSIGEIESGVFKEFTPPYKLANNQLTYQEIANTLEVVKSYCLKRQEEIDTALAEKNKE